MKVALLSIVRPQAGSGEGITEYVYNLYSRLSKFSKIEVTPIYSLERAKRMDVLGIAYTNLFFRRIAGRLAGKNYGIVHIANEELAFLAKRIKRISPESKVVLTLHGLSRTKPGYHRGALQNAYNALSVRGGIRTGLRYSDYVIFNSSVTREDALSLADDKQLLLKKSGIVPLGIDRRFASAKGRVQRRGRLVVGYIGSFTYLKNVIFILKTAALLRSERRISFEIYGFGSGREEEELKAYAEKKGLSNVHFRGVATRDKVVDAYRSFDALMFPSRYEGFGLPILEAQASGLPVLVYRLGRTPEEVTKYCLRVGDEREAALALQKLRANGYDKIKQKAAKAYALSFSWDKTAQETAAVYRKLCKRAR
jgi:glycosyltransferase involved in cell wall biosynthesis